MPTSPPLPLRALRSETASGPPSRSQLRLSIGPSDLGQLERRPGLSDGSPASYRGTIGPLILFALVSAVFG